MLRTTSIVFFFLVLFLFLVVVKVFNVSYPVLVTNTSKSSELSVVGEGKVDVVPDTAFVDVGVNINNVQTVDEAQAGINKVNNKIIESLKALGIDKKNIKTSNYSIYPNYDYSKETTGEITGYNGNVTISIKTDDVTKVPQVIESATKAGANQVQGTRFEVGDPAKYRSEARNKAIQNAQKEAKLLADSLGIKLGKVVNIVESTGTTTNGEPAFYAERAMGGGGGPSIEPGSQTITSVVSLYFEKK
jgi:hypothetical protein